MKTMYGYLVTMFVIGSVSCVQAELLPMQYTQVHSVSEFDAILKKNKHTVVWFYDDTQQNKDTDSESLPQIDSKRMEAIYNNVARAEQNKDITFASVDVATKEGREIFVRYNELNDDTLVELPAILLFQNGKMIDNEINGVMTEKRIESFIERSFKIK